MRSAFEMKNKILLLAIEKKMLESRTNSIQYSFVENDEDLKTYLISKDYKLTPSLGDAKTVHYISWD